MSAGWVAGTVRARGLVAGLPGAAAAAEVASATSLKDAVSLLAPTVYGEHVHAVESLVEAEREVSRAMLWQLRVLAGWLPLGGSEIVRSLAGWFEIRVIEERLAALRGEAVPSRYVMGRLGVVARRVAAAATVDAVRRVLADSTWHQPRDMTRQEVHAHLTARWGERVHHDVPQAQAWVDAAVAVAAMRDARAKQALRSGATQDGGRMPDVAGIWRAERQWWDAVGASAERMLRSRIGTPEVVVGACALMAVDAHRIVTALELAERGGGHLESDDAAA